MSNDDGKKVMSLADVQAFARQQLDAIPPTRYEVGPQEAYQQGGMPYGAVTAIGGKCRQCDHVIVAYSQAGVREAAMSKMCEPCFDYTMIHPEDRTLKEETWMRLVKHGKVD